MRWGMVLNPHAIRDAYKRSSGHLREVLGSGRCGCFHCLETFAPSEVREWIDAEQTALCPSCGIDSVIGDASGYPAGDRGFLRSMRQAYFR